MCSVGIRPYRSSVGLVLGPAEVFMFGPRDRLAVRMFGLLAAVAEGPIAIGALVLIVLLVTHTLWARW
jgi:hypothetical protein